MIVKTCKVGIHRCILRAAPAGEHLGVVGYAGAELVAMHSLMWWCSVLICAFGVIAIVFDKFAPAAE